MAISLLQIQPNWFHVKKSEWMKILKFSCQRVLNINNWNLELGLTVGVLVWNIVVTTEQHCTMLLQPKIEITSLIFLGTEFKANIEIYLVTNHLSIISVVMCQTWIMKILLQKVEHPWQGNVPLQIRYLELQLRWQIHA